jgi:DNA invertase Pin-like site-specific DNA recombinase
VSGLSRSGHFSRTPYRRCGPTDAVAEPQYGDRPMNAVDQLERAVLYLRVSTARQETEGTSLQTQETACRVFAADRGYRVVAAFSDVYTGEDVFNRPGMADLRALLWARGTDVVIAYALDRVSRNQAHQGRLSTRVHS